MGLGLGLDLVGPADAAVVVAWHCLCMLLLALLKLWICVWLVDTLWCEVEEEAGRETLYRGDGEEVW